jgi:hypothetical protein
MAENRIEIKSFLGKYFAELNYSAVQEKYKSSKLDEFFEQKFHIQNNKTELVVDEALPGLSVLFSGNRIQISKEFYDHPNVLVSNSLENQNSSSVNPKSLYNPEIFSTLAYLICQNHTTIQIIGDIDEPVYVRYSSDFETFYSTVCTFEVSTEADVEIVEEVESRSALNVVANYIAYESASISLSTFYRNTISSTSMMYRNIILQDNSKFNHVLLGKCSQGVIDENRLHTSQNSKSEFLGIIDGSRGGNFHSILYVTPVSINFDVSVDYRNVVKKDSSVSFFPLIAATTTENAMISVSDIYIEESTTEEINLHIKEVIDRAVLTRIGGSQRFYVNKKKFLHHS